MYYQSLYDGATSGQYPYGGGVTYQQIAYHPQYQYQLPYTLPVAGSSRQPQYGIFHTIGPLPLPSQSQTGPVATGPATCPSTTQHPSPTGPDSNGQAHASPTEPQATSSATSLPPAGNESTSTAQQDNAAAPVNQDIIDALRKVTEQNFESLDATKLKEQMLWFQM